MKTVIALGFFDGVHLGHGALLKRTVEVARAEGWVGAAITFDRHPASAAAGGRVPLLTTTADRAELMDRLYNIQEVILLSCDRGILSTPWREFVTDFLVGEHQAAHLVAGADFRFGRFGEGTADKLRDLCKQLGVGCDIIPAVALDGVTVSSTHIRSLVEAGDMEEAARFLGHPYCLTAPVGHGKKLGSRLGFPTVNLPPPSELLLPAYGVYAARAWVLPEYPDHRPCLPGSGPHLAAVNVGRRPTVNDGQSVSVEAFLLDFDGDLYGRTVRLELYRRLRAETRFDSLEELKQAVARDVAMVRAYWKG